MYILCYGAVPDKIVSLLFHFLFMSLCLYVCMSHFMSLCLPRLFFFARFLFLFLFGLFIFIFGYLVIAIGMKDLIY